MYEHIYNHIVQPIQRAYRAATTEQAIVVGGLGRCGTMLVHTALKRAWLRETPFVDRLQQQAVFQAGRLYKTHDYPPPTLPAHVKTIFMFGHPFDIVLSTQNQINHWGRRHFSALSADGFHPNDDLIGADLLGLERLFDAWYQSQGFEFISIRYESLCHKQTLEILWDYLGFRFQLPPYRPRRTNWQEFERKSDLIAVYGELQEKIERAKDCEVWPARSVVEESYHTTASEYAI